MTTTSSDRRRYGVIETEFRTHEQVAVYTLSIGGQTWAQVEWSPSRRRWCIQDGSGQCLAHCDAIHGQDVDAQTAVALAKRMIIDGTMPTPEDAVAARRERERERDLGEPMPPIAERVGVSAYHTTNTQLPKRQQTTKWS